jgi:hypothetical protein
MDLAPLVIDLARSQSGVVTRRQLLANGVAVGQLRWRFGRSWRQLLPGVVLLSPELPTLHQRHVAALLYAGQRSWLSGPTAATLHGFLREEHQVAVHVLVPPTAKPRTVQWLTVRRTSLVNERLVERGPLRLSCRPRAVVDVAALMPEADARALVIHVVRRRLVRLDDVGMAVMVHSRRFHSGSLKWDSTVTEDGDLSAHRIVDVGVTPEQLTRNPRSVLRRVEAAYLLARQSSSDRRSWRPRDPRGAIRPDAGTPVPYPQGYPRRS